MPKRKGFRPTVEINNQLRRELRMRAVFDEGTGKISITIFKNQGHERCDSIPKQQRSQLKVILINSTEFTSPEKPTPLPTFIRRNKQG